MSEATTRRRIQAQASASDQNAMGFVLDAPLQSGSPLRFDAPDGPPLARALFAIPGLLRIEVAGAAIWAKKSEEADWAVLKPAVAAAIRQVLDETQSPLAWDEAPG